MDEKEKDKRIYLSVPYKQKDEAKKLGARWDPIVKKWYIPSSVRVDVSINDPLDENKKALSSIPQLKQYIKFSIRSDDDEL